MMKIRRKIQRVMAHVIAILPFNRLRIFMFRVFLGYRIGRNSVIGYNVLIDVDEFMIGDNGTIARNNRFFGPIKVLAGDNLVIGKSNQFTCGWSVIEAWAADRGYLRTLEIGSNCLINEGHIFDVIGKISVADGTWIAGFRSQFLAHGASVLDRDITIGARNFIGSAVLFCPGSGIGDDCLVGVGSVLTKRLEESAAIIAGAPAKVIRRRTADDAYDWQKVW